MLEGIGAKLAALHAAGVSALEDPSRAFHGAKGPATLAALSSVDQGCLVLLRRAVEAFRPKPVPPADYPGVETPVVAALRKVGIRDSAGLYGAALTRKARAALAGKAGAPAKAVEELARLANLSRIQWVGATFARVLYDAGYRSVGAVASADPASVFRDVVRANEGGRLYKGKVGLRDMGRLVQLAKELEEEMEP